MRAAATGANPGARLDDLLGALCLAGAWLVLMWLALTALVALVGALPGRLGRAAHAVAARCAPRVVRRGVAILLGATVAGVPLAGAVHATPSPSPAVTAAAAAASSATRDLPALDRLISFEAPTQVGPVAAAPVPSPARPSTPSSTPRPALERPPTTHADAAPADVADDVVVQPGDTLWEITARSLGDDASSVDVAKAWPMWFATNRAVIGDDPGLIRPGQVLAPPSSVEPQR